VQGAFHWHKHDNEDEFFYVVEGHFIIDLEGRTVELDPWQGFTIPKGVMHRPRAPEKTIILMIEGAGVKREAMGKLVLTTADSRGYPVILLLRN
jgi:mannose-6-phosphate isomerase-like protein (cupin superfamily)